MVLFLLSLSASAISSMAVAMVATEERELECSWLWKGSTVMQKTLPALAKREGTDKTLYGDRSSAVDVSGIGLVVVCVISSSIHGK